MRAIRLCAALSILCACAEERPPEREAPPPPVPAPAEPVHEAAPPAPPSSALARLEAIRCDPCAADTVPRFEPYRVVEIDEEARTATETDRLRPAAGAQLRALQRAWRRRIPEDLRDVLERYDGASIIGAADAIELESVETSIELAESYMLDTYPDVRVFANDGGGRLYAYRGREIVLFSAGAPDRKVVVASSFEQLVDHVVAGRPLAW